MLAERVPFPVDYLVLPTLLSFLVCVIVVGAAVLAVSAGPPSPLRIGAAAVFMGLGIVAMHYIGMETLRACAEMVNAAPFVVASAAVAIAASALALWLAFGGGSYSLALAAAALGLAISGMHYTATSGLSLYPRAGAAQAPALSPDLLAVLVAIVAFLVSGGFLLLLLPERVAQAAEAAVAARTPSPGDSAAAPVATVDAGFGTFSPLGGAGSPPRRPATHIPVERNGLVHYLPVDAIVAVHADAHYTKVFDGAASYFCSLSIGEVEQRLDPGRFARVHRSHIVDVRRIVGAKSAATAARSNSRHANAAPCRSVGAASPRSRLGFPIFATLRNNPNSQGRACAWLPVGQHGLLSGSYGNYCDTCIIYSFRPPRSPSLGSVPRRGLGNQNKRKLQVSPCAPCEYVVPVEEGSTRIDVDESGS